MVYTATIVRPVIAEPDDFFSGAHHDKNTTSRGKHRRRRAPRTGFYPCELVVVPPRARRRSPRRRRRHCCRGRHRLDAARDAGKSNEPPSGTRAAVVPDAGQDRRRAWRRERDLRRSHPLDDHRYGRRSRGAHLCTGAVVAHGQRGSGRQLSLRASRAWTVPPGRRRRRRPPALRARMGAQPHPAHGTPGRTHR